MVSVPLAQRAIAGEVGEVVPPARRMLRPDQCAGDLLRGLVVVLVAGRVIRVEKEMPHRRGARRLNPDLRVARFELAPAARQIRQIRPDVAAVGADLVDHERRGALHGVEHLLPLGRGARCAGAVNSDRHAHAHEREATYRAGHREPARTTGARRRADRRRRVVRGVEHHRRSARQIVTSASCGSLRTLGSPGRANVRNGVAHARRQAQRVLAACRPFRAR